MLHRIWPGTQRLLLWGDPLTAAAYSRAFSFCGSDGVEIMEPLSFKGRRGSGIAGDRCAYADASLKPRWDWEKYEYGYRVWGRLLYNPDADPDGWRRYLNKHFGAGAPHVESALANASRILPIITTAHAPSAGNNTYWPEMYMNQSMVDAEHPGPYTRHSVAAECSATSARSIRSYFRASTISPTSCLKGERDGKYSPIEVAQWIEDYAARRRESIWPSRSRRTGKDRPEYRRMAIDVSHSGRPRPVLRREIPSGVLYRIYEKTGDRTALEEAG